MKNLHYPDRSHYQSDEQYQDVVTLFNHMYDIQTKMGAQTGGGSGTPPASLPQGPSNSRISGFNVVGTPTTTGQTLQWNASTGQIEWV